MLFTPVIEVYIN